MENLLNKHKLKDCIYAKTEWSTIRLKTFCLKNNIKSAEKLPEKKFASQALDELKFNIANQPCF